MSPPTLTLDFEVTGANLDALLDSARRDVTALIGEHRHLTDVIITVGADETVSDHTGMERVLRWSARVEGVIAGHCASIGPET